jgi:acetyl esterase/lipase
MKKILLFSLLCLFNYCVSFGQEDNEGKILSDSAKKIPENYTFRPNVIYTSNRPWKGHVDLYLPKAKDKPVPIIINIHGGGWVKGSKETQRGMFGALFANGYAVANVEYRLANTAPAPAAIEDVRCALEYLYQHATELNIDRSRFVMMGVSAGAHLALMGGLLNGDTIFSENCPDACKIKIVAIIDKCGITDVSGVLKGEAERKWAHTWVASNIQNKKFISSISPISYISKNSPPIFIVQSKEDPVVPYEQSVLLYNKLQELGVKSELYTVSQKTHTIFSEEETKIINDKIIKFLKDNGI